MTKDRLKDILNERDTNRLAYEKDGWKYFEEFLPAIELGLKEKPKEVPPVVMKPKEPPKVEPKKVEPKVEKETKAFLKKVETIVKGKKK